MDESGVTTAQTLGRVLDSFTVKEILIGHIDATEKRLDRIEAKLDSLDDNRGFASLALAEHANKLHAGAVGRGEMYAVLLTVSGTVIGAIALLT